MDHLDGYVWLRPPSGGLEWTARPDDVEPATDAADHGSPHDTVLRARVAVANARSRGEVL